MPGMGPFRDNYYDALKSSNVFKRVEASLTANTPATVWTPASGKKWRLKGGALRIVCTTTCDGAEAAGQRLVLCDQNANTPVVTLGILHTIDVGAGSSWPGPQHVGALTIAANATLASADGFINFDLKEGYRSAAANNVLKFALVSATPASVNCSAGVFVLSGVVWGEED